MFDAISKLFSRPGTETASPDPQLAVAALLIHLAAVDGHIDDKERQTIAGALKDHYGLDRQSVEKLMASATRRDADAVDFYQFTAILAKLEEKERIEIIRLMWQVVYADNENHELEDNMVWRVAELIHVTSRQRTILRNRMKKSRL